MHYLLRRPGSYKISERSIANVSSSICILGQCDLICGAEWNSIENCFFRCDFLFFLISCFIAIIATIGFLQVYINGDSFISVV